MGHIRLGILPASKKWREIVGYMAAGDVSVADIANAIADASDKSLQKAIKDPAFLDALWLLHKIPWAAKEQNFAEALAKIGIYVPDNPSRSELIAGYDAAVQRSQQMNAPHVTDLSEMAKHAGITTLNNLIQDKSPKLWEATRQDVQQSVATISSTENFGEMAQSFFSGLVQHNIQYYLDREISKHVGPGRMVPSLGDISVMESALKRHCDETTMIMRTFSKEWYGKNAFHLGKDIDRKATQGFAHVAFTKIRKELQIRSSDGENV